MSAQDSSTPQSDAFWAKYYATTDPRGESPEEFTRRLEQQIGALQARVAHLTTTLDAIRDIPPVTVDSGETLDKARKMAIEALADMPGSGSRPFWCYFTPDNMPLPSTVRQRPGDSEDALGKSGVIYRDIKLEDCRLGRVLLSWCPFEFPRRLGHKV